MALPPDDDEFLEALAHAILEGKTASEVTGESGDADQRAALRQAEILARIADLHQRLPADDAVLNGSVETGSVPLSWGRLTILEELGRGAFGAVYRAHDPRLEREVALKLLWPGRADPDRFIPSMVEEGRLLARIHHPNVVTIYDANVIDGRVGLTMELVRGQTLAQEYLARGPLAGAEVIAVGIEIARALAAVHEAGLLHRDVKAQNVMRRTDGRLVLMDFGAGRQADGDVDDAAITGTPLYLAPEVLEHHRATVQSDIYSLGVIAFYLLTGAYPVSGQTIRELRDAHRAGRRKSLTDLRPDLPAALTAVVERAIAPAPSDRWASAGDMAAALSSIDGPRGARRKHAVIASVALLAVLGAVAFVLLREYRADNSELIVRRLDVPDVYGFGRLSRDGRYLPYSVTPEAFLRGRLVLRDLASGRERFLTTVSDEEGRIENAAVSRDDTQVAYAWLTESARELRVVGTDARTTPRVVLRDETPGGVVDGAMLEPFDWTPDGSAILAFRSRSGESHDIALIDARDGTVRMLKRDLPWPVTMSLSRDGQFVAFDHPDAAATYARDISILVVATGQEYRIVTGAAQDTMPVWMPEDRGVMFTSDRSGTFGLWMIPVAEGRPTGPPRLIRKDIGLIGQMSLGDDGTLFYTQDSGDVDVRIASLRGGRVDPESIAAGAATYLGSNLDPEWSPDGRALAYVSRRRTLGPRAQALVVRSLASGGERVLWPDLRSFSEPRWSPDGRRFLVRGNDNRGRRGPWLIDAMTGAVTGRVGGPRFADMEWAQNNRSLFVIAENRVGRFDLASGRIEDIHRDPRGRQLVDLAVSADERYLAISVAADQGRIFSIEVLPAIGGTAREIFSAARPDVFLLQGWTPDGASLVIARGRNEDSDYVRGDLSIWSVSVAGGAPRPMNVTAPRLRGVKMHPDGAQLAYRVGDPGVDYWIMRNFLQ